MSRILGWVLPWCIGTGGYEGLGVDGDEEHKHELALHKLQATERRLMTKRAETVANVRGYASEGNRARASQVLGQWKKLGVQLQHVKQMISNLEQVSDAKDNLEASRMYAEAMHAEKESFQTAVDSVDVIDSKQLMSDMAGLRAEAGEVQSVLGENLADGLDTETYSDVMAGTDTGLMAELDAFLAQDEAAVVDELPRTTMLPKVPEHNPMISRVVDENRVHDPYKSPLAADDLAELYGSAHLCS